MFLFGIRRDSSRDEVHACAAQPTTTLPTTSRLLLHLHHLFLSLSLLVLSPRPPPSSLSHSLSVSLSRSHLLLYSPRNIGAVLLPPPACRASAYPPTLRRQQRRRRRCSHFSPRRHCRDSLFVLRSDREDGQKKRVKRRGKKTEKDRERKTMFILSGMMHRY